MTSRPIIFTAHSVRAIIAGRKTQSRRIVNLKNLRVRTLCRVAGMSFLAPGLVAKRDTSYLATLNPNGAVAALINGQALGLKPGEFDFQCRYVSGETHLADFGKKLKQWVIEPVGQQTLWIKEGWGVPGDVASEGMKVTYRADYGAWSKCWRSPLMMPRWASRIDLIVESVRLERLQDISDDDAWAEGVGSGQECTMYAGKGRDLFQRTWDSINGKKAPWASSPWVWAIRFRRA